LISRVFLFLFLITACRPSFEERASLIAGPRFLAVRGEPAESKPGEEVHFTSLFVTPTGEDKKVLFKWSFCASPKPLTENTSVSAACLGDAVRPIDSASAEAIAATPDDACGLFGPETPPGDFRPRDPDATGGFYQPIRVEALGKTAFGLGRVTCNLPNAPLDVALELTARYHANQNPKLSPLVASVGEAPAALDRLPAGQEIRFEVGWDAKDAEAFPAFDPRTQALADRREALSVSWYATGGEFEADITGRAEDEAATSVSNRWRAPEAPGRMFLWLVLRDSRGGVDFASYALEVFALR